MPETYDAVRVALDTTALRRDPAMRGGGFEALARFAEAGYVEVYIPQVVASEFASPSAVAAEALASSKKALAELRRHVSGDLNNRIDAFETELVGALAAAQQQADDTLAKWIKRTDAEVVAIAANHSEQVFKRYFAGQPPFREAKSRADLPDAFIFQAFLDLARAGDLLVVTADKRLATALSSVQNVAVFRDTKALIESEVFDDFRTDLLSDYERENVDVALQAFPGVKARFDEQIDEAVSTAVSGRVVSYRNPSWDEKEGEEQLYLDSAGPVSEWEVDISDYEYLGEGVASFQFQATLEVSVDRSTGEAFYDDLYGHSPDMTADVEGAISLILDQKTLKRLPGAVSSADLLDGAEVSIDEIFGVTLHEREF